MRTDDDYYSHLDLYKKADLIFTNPPFTGLYKWVTWLLNMNKEFVLWGPWLSLSWARYKRLSLYNNVLKILTKYTENEINELAELASEIWHEYWPCILTAEQIDYMVEKFQSKKAIKEQIKNENYTYNPSSEVRTKEKVVFYVGLGLSIILWLLNTLAG